MALISVVAPCYNEEDNVDELHARLSAAFAGALQALGSVHALVVHGEPGMDEISPLGLTRVVEIRDGERTEWTIDPERYGSREELTAAVRAAMIGALPVGMRPVE